MLTAIEFVRQCDGKVGEWFAKRSSNQNSFMKSVITDGSDPEVISDMSEKFGTLILPVQHYTAVGSVYHQLKGPFAEYQQYGIVGSELPVDTSAKKSRAPRAPRAPRESAASAAPDLELTKKIQSLENNHIVSLKGLVCAPDEKALEIANLFRSQGKASLAESIEQAAIAAAQEDSERMYHLNDTFLDDIFEVLSGYFGRDAVKKAADRLSWE